MISVSSIFSNVSGIPTKTIEGNKPLNKKWTLMLYDNADSLSTDNSTTSPILDMFKQKAFANENLNIVVLQDTYEGPASMYSIDEHHGLHLLKEMGEINMVNYTTIRDFIEYCKTNFSAERYMFFIYGHGLAWRSAGVDSTNLDRLTYKELRKALDEAGGIDILCFCGPCTVSTIESAYELRNVTKVFIGSEDGSSYFHWKDMIEDLCVFIKNSPSISDTVLGNEIINMLTKRHYEALFNKTYRKNFMTDLIFATVTAIDTSKLENVSIAVNKFALSLAPKTTINHLRIRFIHRFTKAMIVTLLIPKWERVLLDLYDFAKNCKSLFFFNKQIRNNAEDVMKSVNQAVIADFKSIFYSHAHGVSIYFPTNKSNYDADYTSSNLDFLNNTYWDEFLQQYFNNSSD